MVRNRCRTTVRWVHVPNPIAGRSVEVISSKESSDEAHMERATVRWGCTRTTCTILLLLRANPAFGTDCSVRMRAGEAFEYCSGCTQIHALWLSESGKGNVVWWKERAVYVRAVYTLAALLRVWGSIACTKRASIWPWKSLGQCELWVQKCKSNTSPIAILAVMLDERTRKMLS